MRLVMFDLDGTLMESNTLDARCFSKAVASITGDGNIETDWSHYRYVTDQGIMAELLSRAFGRPASPGEIQTVRTRIHQAMLCEIATNGGRVFPVPGAVGLIRYLLKAAECGMAIATGSWKEMALLKLSAAGFPEMALPMASSDDSHRREEIMTIALERSLAFYGLQRFETVVYVGDGMWDLAAAKKLGFRFIGIAGDGTRTRMMSDGAACVFEDFRNREAFMAALGNL